MSVSQARMSEALLYYAHAGLNIRLSFDANQAFGPPPHLVGAFSSAQRLWQSKLPYDSVRALVTLLPYGELLELRGSPILYSELRALKDCFAAEQSAVEPNGYASASLTVVIKSAEGLIMAVQRSDAVAVNPGVWTLGLTEGLDAADFEGGSLFPAVRRALEEELNLAPAVVPDNCIKLLAISYEAHQRSFSILALVDLCGKGAEFRSAALVAGAAGAKDAWEHKQILFLAPSELEGLRARNEYAGTSLVREVLARHTSMPALDLLPRRRHSPAKTTAGLLGA